MADSVRMMAEIYGEVGKILKANGFVANVGNEGAFAPAGITSNKAPLDMIVEAIGKAGYEADKDCGISMDAAASEFFDEDKKRYILKIQQIVSVIFFIYIFFFNVSDIRI